ncbi:MAG TPA: acyl-CoA dehydrogenase family protein [Candidatus Dormibacteraeota bacterium]|nr:acyl-CoA dehydrogenase family protein [Candidatus Dormibacteraeota bacterium]
MDFDLSTEQRELKAMCREFALEVIAPRAEEWNRAHRFPTEVFRQMGELGLCGPLVPDEYGGSAIGMTGYVAAMEELGQGDQSLAAGWNAHCTIGTLPLLHHGSEAQKRRWVVPMAKGEALGAFALTEPAGGSDLKGMETRIRYEGDDVVVDGRKTFISNAGTELSWGVVTLGRDLEGRYVSVAIPAGTPGYSQGEPYQKIGWHALDTREQVFDGVRVPRDHIVGDPDKGLRAFLASLDAGRISIAALAVSLATAALAESLAYAKERRAFGQPIAGFQAIQFKLARMASMIESARLLTYQAAFLYDSGRPYTKEAAIAKFLASEASTFCANEAVQIHGGYGYILDSKVARLYLDSKVLEIGEGTNEIQQIVVARSLGIR